jgi:hypothetical protein
MIRPVTEVCGLSWIEPCWRFLQDRDRSLLSPLATVRASGTFDDRL